MSRFTEPMTAIRSMSYATRRLSAGDMFHAAPKDVRILEAIGKAKRGRPAATVPPPPAGLVHRLSAPAIPRDAAAGIPDDWRNLSWPQLRSLAARLRADDGPIRTKEDAVAAIELHIEAHS
jgi:hypothetical protein